MGFFSSLFGGPSTQEINAQAAMSTASTDMAYDASVTFGQDQAMFKSLSSAIAPTLAQGPSQFGMSPAQEAAERTMLSEQISQAGQQESQLVNESLASRNITPGAGISPAALAEIEGALAQKYAVANATGQLGITEKGYDIGRQNFWNATSEGQNLLGAQGTLSANLAKTGVEAGTQAFSEADTINSQRSGMLKGILGLAGGVLGAIPGIGTVGKIASTGLEMLGGQSTKPQQGGNGPTVSSNAPMPNALAPVVTPSQSDYNTFDINNPIS